MWFFSRVRTWTGSIFQPLEQKWFQWLNLFSIFQFFGWTPCFLDMGLFQKKQTNKKKRPKVEDILFKKNPEIFHVFTLPLEILDKRKLHPWIFYKIMLEKPRPLEIPNYFFWSALKIPILLWLTPGNSIHYFFDATENSTSSATHPQPPVWFFFWISPFQIMSWPKRKIILATVLLIEAISVWDRPVLVLCFLFAFTIYSLGSYITNWQV